MDALSPDEYVNIRVYRADRDRLAAKMRYGESMADRVRGLLDAEKQAKSDAAL